eukprot:620401-Amphidinium_carterae.1
MHGGVSANGGSVQIGSSFVAGNGDGLPNVLLVLIKHFAANAGPCVQCWFQEDCPAGHCSKLYCLWPQELGVQ